MPATTADFHTLCHSFATARGSIRELPDFDIRDEIDEMRLKSFVFLCHAALEEYLERVTLDALQRARSILVERRIVPKLVVSAVTHYQINLRNIQSCANANNYFIDALLELSNEAIKCHAQATYENNGITTRDQDKLSAPLGVRVHDFDHVLSQNLNSFGQDRGRIAHGFRIKQKIPKAGCVQSVATLESLLLPFDQEIDRLCQEVWL